MYVHRRVLDQHRFDAVSASLALEASNTALMLLDRDLRIRGVNATYEVLSLRPRGELLGELVSDVFPDNPDDAQARGTEQLAVSVESAMRRRATDSMPIVRYDITDPQEPDVFLPKVWTCQNVAVDDGNEQFGVLHQVAEITSLDEALSALSRDVAGGESLVAAEHMHVLAALATKAREDQSRARAMTGEIEQLQRAVETRDIIGQAKGMLMERFNVDAAAAFDLLARLSQEANIRLVDIAHKLVEMDHPTQ
ncbi:MAG: ANTAR domain-containing protein [Actinomycetota bacterium]|uniref:ANTAR domain-containing protein n=1 Tax=Mycobacterium lentiflavum TaxID=141349 RepID=A0ABY3UVI4_MYCLN|nr:ANTAR domain-containing protein [Mycobacterium lentiflavum]MEE3067240.1 ANTAR domain-containing protein [Actinomycetota bacterium]ULP43598.1 ANTAR domain-containing protein [Mycobacterium lentiflavum]